MITDVQHDGMKWTVTINNKYVGESWFIIIAVNIALWKFIIEVLKRNR